MTHVPLNQSALPQRILHTMIRVRDLERSVAFYCTCFGMRELRREDYPDGRFTLSFIGYGAESDSSVIELTYNYDPLDYAHGTGFGHIALEVEDIAAACERLDDMGATILRQPGPMMSATRDGKRDVIAFIADPDGYRIELIQASPMR